MDRYNNDRDFGISLVVRATRQLIARNMEHRKKDGGIIERSLWDLQKSRALLARRDRSLLIAPYVIHHKPKSRIRGGAPTVVFTKTAAEAWALVRVLVTGNEQVTINGGTMGLHYLKTLAEKEAQDALCGDG